MSLPITACLVNRATRGDAKAFEALVSRLRYGISKGCFSTWPCEHTPRCSEAAPGEYETLAAKLAVALERNLRSSKTEAGKAPSCPFSSTEKPRLADAVNGAILPQDTGAGQQKRIRRTPGKAALLRKILPLP